MLALLFWIGVLVVAILLFAEFFGDGEHASRCPVCGMGDLHRIFRGEIRGGPHLFRCEECKRVFREQFDGRLVEADPADPVG